MANIIVAQLLYLDAIDPNKTIQRYGVHIIQERNSVYYIHVFIQDISKGHFLLEEDDKFLNKEERQALAAADIDAVKDAIATIEVSRKTIPTYPESRNPIFKSLSTMEGSCITSERGSYNIKYVTFMIVNIRKLFTQGILEMFFMFWLRGVAMLDIEFRESANEQGRRMIEVISG
uniref:Uncharacterized protein n=1 Tax=Cucumis melo TaxID=3656 RepID=A0A9I9ECR5_CUCME